MSGGPFIKAGFGGSTTGPNGADVTLTLTGAQENDIVLVFGGHSNRATFVPGPSTAGYASVFNHVAASPFFDISWKRMSSSPDANVVCRGTGNAVDATAYCAYLIAGAITSGAPFDVTLTTQGPTTSTDPICPAITTVTDHCLIICAAMSTIQDASTTPPTGFNNYLVNFNANDTGEDVTAAGGSVFQQSLGLITPGAWAAWGSGAWIGATLAVKPATVSTGRNNKLFGLVT